jgi:hypothetical protein
MLLNDRIGSQRGRRRRLLRPVGAVDLTDIRLPSAERRQRPEQTHLRGSVPKLHSPRCVAQKGDFPN